MDAVADEGASRGRAEARGRDKVTNFVPNSLRGVTPPGLFTARRALGESEDHTERRGESDERDDRDG